MAGEPWTPAGLDTSGARPVRLFDCPDGPDELPWGVSLMRVPDPLRARALLAPADPEEARRRSAVFHLPKAYRARARLPLGQHDRLEEYLLADGRLHEADRRVHALHFPIHLKSIRLRELRLAAGETADLSAHAADWPGLHFREELYLRVSIDRLVVAPGAVLRWAGNIASIRIEKLVAAAPVTPEAPFTIQVGGTPHHAHSGLRRMAAMAGIPGMPGRDGRDGVAAGVHHTPFGPQPLGPPAAADGRGETGASGTPGSAGSQGRNGGMVMHAGIEIFAVEGVSPAGFRLHVEAQPGEAGGAGGDGGPGGAGGAGAPGWAHPARARTAGSGGDGGEGGRGGDGGRGGAGGLASHVFVTLPQRALDILLLDARPAAGGAGGLAGTGGTGGSGGAGGRGADRPFLGRDADGERGRDGARGAHGRAGPAGRSGGAPLVWLHAAPARPALAGTGFEQSH